MEKRSYNLTEELIESKRIDENFINMLDGLSLEEILGLKLETAAKLVKGKMYGLKIYHTLPVIIRESLIKYTCKNFSTKSHAANFLGITLKRYNSLIRRRGIVDQEEHVDG
jgi:hypothetical protein